jgi:sn-glycerol 3-phosphate transport system substrate-binding protein
MAEPSRRSVVASSLGCTALVVVLIVGCSGSDDDPTPDPPGPTKLASCEGPPPGQRVTITLAHAEGDARGGLIEGYVDRFEAMYPDISVEIQPTSEGSGNLMADWRRSTPAERPDVTLLPQEDSGRLIGTGQTVAPGGCIRQVARDMLPVINAAWSWDGVLQAVPFAVSTPVLYYNRKLFTAARLDPDDPPSTLGELQMDAFKMVSAGVADYGLVFDTGPESGGGSMVDQITAETGAVSLTPDNGRRRPAASVAWRTGPAAEYVEWLAKMTDEHLALSIGRNKDGTEDLLRAADPNSPIAMAFHTCGALGDVIDALPAIGGPDVDLGIAPLPTLGSGLEPGQGSLPGGSALWLASGKSEAETAAAWKLASFLASPEIQAEWTAATGYVPISPASARLEPLATRWREHREMRVAYDVLADQKEATPVELGPLAGPLPEIHEVLAHAVEDVTGEGIDPSAALAAAAADADRLLAAYNSSKPAPRLSGLTPRRLPSRR